MTIEPAPRELTPEPAPPGPVQGESRVDISVSLAPGTRLRVTVESLDLDDTPLDENTVLIRTEEDFSRAGGSTPGAPRPPRIQVYALPAMPGVRAAGKWALPGAGDLLERARALIARSQVSTQAVLLALCVGIYFLTRVIGLADWPIYFFTDEAIGTVHAADLVAGNFFGEGKEFLPTYFLNGNMYNRGLDIYLQILPFLLFGKSIVATRMVSVLLTTLAAAWLGLILRDFFKIRVWWAGVLFLSITPAWFLHSRTAFETVQMVSFYTGFLYFYLLYRYRAPHYLYAALVLGAMAFYTYNPGRVVVVVSGLLLLLSDARYHWQNRKTALKGLGLLALLAVPFLRFAFLHPEGNVDHLRQIDSYWTTSIPLAEKIRQYLEQYLTGLSPGYWFVPNELDLVRHLMKGYGHMLRATLPFTALGLGLALRHALRSPAHRLILIALLAAPTGAALVQIGVTRVLVFVIPAALLTTLGVSAVLQWLEQRRIPRIALEALLLCGLAAVNISMLSDALRNGPTWYGDYTMVGMQYGARQVFSAVDEIRRDAPGTRVIVSTDWANGTDVLARFFQTGSEPYELATIHGWMQERRELDDEMVFVMMPDEYRMAQESGRFSDIRVERELPTPDGKTGFYFLRLRYSDNFDELLAEDIAKRRQLQPQTIRVNGMDVDVLYSTLDMGEIDGAFDGDSQTVIRTLEANPLVIELTFPEPLQLTGLTARIGAAASQVKAVLQSGDGADPLTVAQTVGENQGNQDVSLNFGSAVWVTEMRLEISNSNETEPAHVHLWEIFLTEAGATAAP